MLKTASIARLVTSRIIVKTLIGYVLKVAVDPLTMACEDGLEGEEPSCEFVVLLHWLACWILSRTRGFPAEPITAPHR